MRKSSISSVAIFIIVLFTIIHSVNLNRWNTDRIIENDAVVYYAYLPATFIFQDLTFDFKKSTKDPIVKKKTWLSPVPNGNSVLKMTMGNAICWTPFFLTAHAYASLSDEYDNNGYSIPYSFLIAVAAWFYLFISLLFLRKLLRLYFSDYATAVTLIAITLGTNLFYYAAVGPGMSHTYSFAMITLFLYLFIVWMDKLNYARSVLLGLLLGLIILIRASNGLIIIFPVLLLLFSNGSMHEKVDYLRKNYTYILIAGLFTFLAVFPQLYYWKVITGHWLYNSYSPETFYFSNPHILKGLFGFRKGWFIYTPMMFISVFGLYYLRKTSQNLLLPIIIFLIINVYVVYSWWCWWYGGSFSSRPMIDIYAIMSIPFAAFIDHIIQQVNWKKILSFLVILFFIYLNQHQVNQYQTGILHWDSMTREAYFEILFKKNYPENYKDLIKKPDYKNAKKGMCEYK